LEDKNIKLKTELDQTNQKVLQFKKKNNGAEEREIEDLGAISLDDVRFLKFQLKKYKAKLLCSVCNTNEKDTILPCNHMFCRECINKNIESRQRQCPMDRKKIGHSDVKAIYWGSSDQM